MIASDGPAAVVRLVAGPGGAPSKAVSALPVPGGRDKLLSKLCCCLPWVPLQQRVRAGEAVERMWPSEGRQLCRWG